MTDQTCMHACMSHLYVDIYYINDDHHITSMIDDGSQSMMDDDITLRMYIYTGRSINQCLCVPAFPSFLLLIERVIN